MVRVVPQVTDGHVLEQSSICSMDIIRPGLDLLSTPPHASHALILQPRITLWDEVQDHVQYPRRHELVRNSLTSRSAFHIRQFGIEVSSH